MPILGAWPAPTLSPGLTAATDGHRRAQCAPYTGVRHMNMESLYEYGSRAGFWRLHRILTEREVPVTV